ncbi:MAG: RES family NAD+ phosphorylase [Pyrinomonadaceae bacterium]
MNCCTECFTSPTIKTQISAKKDRGDCDLCGTKNVLRIDARELFYKVSSLLDLYDVTESGEAIAEALLRDFPDSVFALSDPAKVTVILKEIFGEDISAYSELFENRVALRASQDANYLARVDTLVASWENFSEEIKGVNRFHLSNALDLEQLAALFAAIEIKIERGTIFYRARICDEVGHGKENMGAPPASLASAGRANPVGISYLYLAGDIETTLFEVRAGPFDYVTVADFRLKQDIRVVDLQNVSALDPFTLSENELLETYVAFRPFLIRLGEEISRPNRRNDSEMDYIPTQYLAEFIKSQAIDGIGYQSSLNSTGHNYAMFEPNKFECIKLSVHEIERIEFSHRAIKFLPV